jgi:hypothetical protein
VRGVSASLGDGRCQDPRPIASPTQITPMPSQTGTVTTARRWARYAQWHRSGLLRGQRLEAPCARAASGLDAAAIAIPPSRRGGEVGVKVQPLSWHCQTPQRPGLVLGYAASPVSAIEQGISLLARSYREVSPAGE